MLPLDAVLAHPPRPDAGPPGTAGGSSDLDLARRQLAGIDRWHERRRAGQDAARGTAASREVRMDQARRTAVLQAQHQAIVERTTAHLGSSVDLLRTRAPVRAVVVHRSSWFCDTLAAALTGRDVRVVAELTNGAQAVGVVVAEQPDLLLVEDTLPMLSGEDVVREVRTLAPTTRIGAQVAYQDRIAAMLDAGAHSAWTRQVPPADVAAALVGLLPAGTHRAPHGRD